MAARSGSGGSGVGGVGNGADVSRMCGTDMRTTLVPVALTESTRSATSARTKSSICGAVDGNQGWSRSRRRSATSRNPPHTTTTSGRVAVTAPIQVSRTRPHRSASGSTRPSDNWTQPPTDSPQPGAEATVISSPSIGASSGPDCSDAASSSPTTSTFSGGMGAVEGAVAGAVPGAAPACASSRLLGPGRSLVTTAVPTSRATSATPATAAPRGARRRMPDRTGCSISRYITTAAARVTAIRSANSGHGDQPTRGGRQPQEDRPVQQVHAVADAAQRSERAPREGLAPGPRASTTER